MQILFLFKVLIQVLPRDKIPYELRSLELSLVKQAQKDGYISADEAELINRVQIDVREFENKIIELKKQYSEEKNIKLIQSDAFSQILKNATQTALKDGNITEEEEEMLKVIREKLSSFSQNE